MNRSKGFLRLLGALAALCVAPLCAAQTGVAAQDASGSNPGSRWVAAWSSAQQQPGLTTIDAIFGNDHSRSFENQTIRNYRERVRQCEDLGEYACAEVIREILKQEQEHQIDLATALGEDVPDVSKAKSSEAPPRVR